MKGAVVIGICLGLGVYCVMMIALLQVQWHRLKCSDTDTALTVGLVRIVMDLFNSSASPQETAMILENSRFRSIKISAFTFDGEVIFDSGAPCASKNGNTSYPTARQLELYKAVIQSEDKKNVTGQPTTGTIYRPCDASSSSDAKLTTFASVKDKAGTIFVATSCGHEN